MTHAACAGAVLTLLAVPKAERDAGLAAASREAVVAAITGTTPGGRPGPSGAAITLRATLDGAAALTPGERALMAELLDRIIDAASM